MNETDAVKAAQEWLKDDRPLNLRRSQPRDIIGPLLAKIAELEGTIETMKVLRSEKNKRIAKLEQSAANIRRDTLAEFINIIDSSAYWSTVQGAMICKQDDLIAAIKALGGE